MFDLCREAPRPPLSRNNSLDCSSAARWARASPRNGVPRLPALAALGRAPGVSLAVPHCALDKQRMCSELRPKGGAGHRQRARSRPSSTGDRMSIGTWQHQPAVRVWMVTDRPRDPRSRGARAGAGHFLKGWDVLYVDGYTHGHTHIHTC